MNSPSGYEGVLTQTDCLVGVARQTLQFRAIFFALHVNRLFYQMVIIATLSCLNYWYKTLKTKPSLQTRENRQNTYCDIPVENAR